MEMRSLIFPWSVLTDAFRMETEFGSDPLACMNSRIAKSAVGTVEAVVAGSGDERQERRLWRDHGLVGHADASPRPVLPDGAVGGAGILQNLILVAEDDQ